MDSRWTRALRLFTLGTFLASLAGCSETPTARRGDGGTIKKDGLTYKDGPRADGPENDGPKPPTPDGQPPAPDGPTVKPDSAPPATGGYFPAGAPWYQDYTNAKVATNSTAIINWLSNAGGWGTGQMRIDFGIEVLQADASTPMRTFTPNADHYTPDCDIAKVPVPVGGAIEGESGYNCASDGDCHLIVVHQPSKKLYEMWRADIQGSSFSGGCLAIWDMTRVYGPKGRGDQCTSADAAGFPIAPLLFTADEVKAGAINHAIRFILPNSRIRTATMVRPATHGIKNTGGGSNAPPYGVHLRLKASFDISKLKAGAQVVAKAMKKYGLFHADGGDIALTAQSDRFTTAKWSGLLGAYDLSTLKVTDFEVIDHGPTIPVSYDCAREP